jgi:hypothetical protein
VKDGRGGHTNGSVALCGKPAVATGVISSLAFMSRAAIDLKDDMVLFKTEVCDDK